MLTLSPFLGQVGCKCRIPEADILGCVEKSISQISGASLFEKMQNRKNDGFTLVELIVVIAILAIMAGVAVPAYSGYVEKANIAADQALVSDVVNALTLYYYDNYGKSETPISGHIVLTTSGNTTDGDAAAAMNAVFGEGAWAELKLKHNGWTSSAGTVDMENVNSSSFGEAYRGEMMERVSSLSGVLADYFGSGATYKPLQDYMKENNITTTDPQVLANLAVLQAANSVTGVDATKFTNAYVNYGGVQLANELQKDNGANLDKMTAYAVAYAQMEGTLNYIEAQAAASGSDAQKQEIAEIKKYWADESKELKDVQTVEALLNAVEGKLYNETSPVYSFADAYVVGDQSAKDASAFISYMTGVQEVAPSLTDDLSEMASSDFYKGGTVNGLVEDYISAGTILNGSAAGSVTVFFKSNGVSFYPVDILG